MFVGDADRQAEAARRKRGRNRAVFAVLVGFALLLYALAIVRLAG